MTCIVALLPESGHAPTTPPEELPFGRAALQAAALGLRVVFGELGDSPGHVKGFEAIVGGWSPLSIEVTGVFDRFRSQLHPERYAATQARLGHLPWGNSPEVIALCRDKWASQQLLEAAGVPMPEVARLDLQTALQSWGTAFLKPQFGSFGRHVRRVVLGDGLASTGPGMRSDDIQSYLLQRAIQPPTGWAGVSVRALVQREGKEWICRTPVARRSKEQAVVNVARGAEVGPASLIFGTGTAELLASTAIRAAEAISEVGRTLEVGVDLVVDPAGAVWVIEVNGRPRGRLSVLASQSEAFNEEHRAACLAPLLQIAATS